jgi:hypothetical protein
MKLAVVIAAYNERETLEERILRITLFLPL